MIQSAAKNVYSNIGLALSGGGYRAAGFHFGLLAYLNHIDLLSQVTMISTVSGGTFTGAKYALSLVEGKTFAQFYQEYYGFLKNTKLVELALGKLGKKESNIPSGRTDLITAVAQVYADTFLLNKVDDQPYRFGDILDADISLKEIIFNSTEFRYGLDFRFQRSAKPKARIGNGSISITKAEAADIRVADIVAASSCFPGGFEPLAFPEDFNWSSPEILEGVRQRVYQNISPEIALMDGGIYDNQGIESLYLADQRSSKDHQLDLFIISDVDQQSKELYDFPAPIKVADLSLHWVDWISKIAIALCLLTVVSIVLKAAEDIIKGQFIWLDLLLYLVPLLLATGTAFLLGWIRNAVQNKILPKIPQAGYFAWDDLKQLTLSQVANGIYLRVTSLQAMAGSVFMKRIRRLGYNQIYKDKHREKLVSNLIYELKSGSTLTPLPGVQSPSKKLLKIIDAAADMPTTLWFTQDNQLNNLIISGQATICYSLMVNITRRNGKDVDAFPQDAKNLWHKLTTDWGKLCSEPQVLHEERF
ncbi:MAG: patatin-like phospholipase family protein [Cyanobacteria bacterium J06621_12]